MPSIAGFAGKKMSDNSAILNTCWLQAPADNRISQAVKPYLVCNLYWQGHLWQKPKAMP